MSKTIEELQAENEALAAQNAALAARTPDPPPAPVEGVDHGGAANLMAIAKQIADNETAGAERMAKLERLVSEAASKQTTEQTGLKPEDRKLQFDGTDQKAYFIRTDDPDDGLGLSVPQALGFQHVGHKALDSFFGASPRSAQERELHALYDYVQIAGQAIAKRRGMSYPQAVKSLRMYGLLRQELAADSELKKALDTATSGEGADWIPTGYSQDLIDRVVILCKVAGLFQTINMPTNPYKLPTLITGSTSKLVSESLTDNATAIPASTAGTGAVTLTAFKHAVRQLFSDEVAEDSIIPILPMVRNDAALALAEGQEKTILDGDTTSPHRDTDVTAASDVRFSVNGLRHSAADHGTNVDGSTFAIGILRSVYKAQGKFAADPSKCAWITGTTGMCQLLGLTQVLTLDKIGPQATVLNGTLGMVDGRPIVVSEFVREDLSAAANPIYAVGGAYTYLLHVYRPGFVIGRRGVPKITQGDIVETQQTQVVSSMRWDLQPVWATATYDTCKLAYKIS